MSSSVKGSFIYKSAMIQIDYLSDHRSLLPELARLHFEEWSYLAPQETLEERTRRLTGLCGRRKIPAALVAVDGPHLVGSALLVAHDMSTRKDLSPWLAGVYVKSAYRCQGVGTRLIARVEAEAAALNVPRLHLYTPSEEKFYMRRGWHTIERTEYRNAQVTVMDKTVAR